MAYAVVTLRPRHHEIIRQAFLGLKSVQIAERLGITPVSVNCILASPLAQAELARLRVKAEETITNVPMRVRLESTLRKAAEEAVNINYDLMTSHTTDAKLRARIGMHFQDRVIFDDTENEKEGSYREILRQLDKLGREMPKGDVLIMPPPDNAT